MVSQDYHSDGRHTSTNRRGTLRSEQKLSGHFAKIPVEYIERFKTISAFKVFAVIASASRGSGDAEISQEKIAEISGLPPRSVRAGITSLIDSDLLSVLRTGRGNLYKIGIGENRPDLADQVAQAGSCRSDRQDLADQIGSPLPVHLSIDLLDQEEIHTGSTHKIDQEGNPNPVRSESQMLLLPQSAKQPPEEHGDIPEPPPAATQSKNDPRPAQDKAPGKRKPQNANEEADYLEGLWRHLWAKNGRKLRGGKHARLQIKKGLKEYGFDRCRWLLLGHSLSEYHAENGYVAPQYAFKPNNADKFEEEARASSKKSNQLSVEEVVDWFYVRQADADWALLQSETIDGPDRFMGIGPVDGWREFDGEIYPLFASALVQRSAWNIIHGKRDIAAAPTRQHRELAQGRYARSLSVWHAGHSRMIHLVKTASMTDEGENT